MKTITKCLNEWNATIEALGQGEQTILIRKYATTLNEFLLYPTVSYANKEDYLDSFDKKHRKFARKNTLPEKQDDKYLVKYYATVGDVIKKNNSRIGTMKDYHIWTKKHVKSYLENKPGQVWLLRVYKLENPQYISRTKGIVYANVEKEISLNNIEPVITDKKYNKIKKEIINKK